MTGSSSLTRIAEYYRWRRPSFLTEDVVAVAVVAGAAADPVAVGFDAPRPSPCSSERQLRWGHSSREGLAAEPLVGDRSR